MKKPTVANNSSRRGDASSTAAITNAVYKTQPYKSHGAHPDTSNASDAIYRNGGRRSQLSMRRSTSGAYVPTITMGVIR